MSLQEARLPDIEGETQRLIALGVASDNASRLAEASSYVIAGIVVRDTTRANTADPVNLITELADALHAPQNVSSPTPEDTVRWERRVALVSRLADVLGFNLVAKEKEEQNGF